MLPYEARAQASAAVCSEFGAARLAVCVAGKPRLPRLTFSSLGHNLLPAAGNASTLILSLTLTPRSQSPAALRAIASELLPPSTILRIRCQDRLHSPSAHRCGEVENGNADLEAQRGCLHEISELERGGDRFEKVLLIPADHLVLLPLWPHCFLPKGDRVAWSGSVKWMSRQAAESALLNRTAPYRSHESPELRISLPALELEGPLRRPSDVCERWRDVLPPYRFPTTNADPCAFAWSLSNHSMALFEEGATAQRVCGPPQRLALCIGGLARSFSHALSWQTVRGHLMHPLGAHITTFAALRLEDERGLTAANGKDFSATASASRNAVLLALRELGVEEANMKIERDARVPPPRCSGSGGVYEWDRGPSSNASQRSCRGYQLPCSQLTIDGMLTTRATLFKMVVEHEARTSVTFESVLYIRPDVVVLFPALPWCFYPSSYEVRVNQDWLEWYPRRLAEAALDKVAANYYGCKLPDMSSMTKYAEHAAKLGAELKQDDSLRALVHLLRVSSPNLPHKKDCRELRLGLLAFAPSVAETAKLFNESDGLLTKVVHESDDKYKHCASCPLTACGALTFGNRYNAQH